MKRGGQKRSASELLLEGAKRLSIARLPSNARQEEGAPLGATDSPLEPHRRCGESEADEAAKAEEAKRALHCEAMRAHTFRKAKCNMTMVT